MEKEDRFCCEKFKDAFEEGMIWRRQIKTTDYHFYFRFCMYKKNMEYYDLEWCPFCGKELNPHPKSLLFYVPRGDKEKGTVKIRLEEICCGSVVMLKSEREDDMPRKMVVEERIADSCLCTWLDFYGRPQERRFDVSCLIEADG